MQNMKMDGASFFGSMQTKTAKSVTFGEVADASAPAGGFSELLESAKVTPEALNSEAAFSAMELLSMDEEELIHKIESLESIDALLKRVSNLLGLNIDMEKSLYRVDPEDVPEEMVSQLADFLMGLREFTQLLKHSGEQNIPVEVNGEELSGEEVLLLSEKIGQETLNLELQFTKLGITDKIASALKELQNQPGNGGIPVAANPQELAEGGQPLPESLTALLEQEEGELESIISSIRMLASKAKNETGSAETLSELSKQGENVKDILTGANSPQGQTGNGKGEAGSGEQQAETDSKNLAAVPKTETASPETTLKTSSESVSLETSPVTSFEVASEKIKSDVKKIESAINPDLKEKKVPQGERLNPESVVAEGGDGLADGSEDTLTKLVKHAVKTESKEKNSSTDSASQSGDGGVESLSVKPTESGVLESLSITTEDGVEVNPLNIELPNQVESTEIFKAPAAGRAHTPRTFEQLVVDQVSGKLTDAVRSGSREVTIVLRPEFLGEVKVTIQVDGDLVAAKLQVESQQVKQIIENNFQNLRDALQEQNLKTGSLDVNVGNGDNYRRAEEEQQPRRRRRAGIPSGIEEFDSDPFVEDFMGKETGRRFGNNSVEYFA